MARACPLLVRADASIEIGTGHVMRCLALAQAWQEAGGLVHFALASATPAIKERLRAEGIDANHLDVLPGSASDAVQTIDLAQQTSAAWVMVDGYQFDAAYQVALKAADLRLLFVDDYGHANHYHADLVLNQNLHADPSLYANREPYTTLLLGTRYALLRREFWPWRGWRREIHSPGCKILVTLGGADPDNTTLKVMQALQHVEMPELEATVVVGGINPHYEELQSTAQSTCFPIRLETNATNMPELMAWADVAVSAAGSTCWELAFMGLPSVVLVLADNQDPIAKGLDSAGVVTNLGRQGDVTVPELSNSLAQLLRTEAVRARMCSLGRQLVDGSGGHRVALELIGGNRG